MKTRTVLIALTATGLLGAAGLGIGASATSQPSLMSPTDYQALRGAITKAIDDDIATCESYKATAKSECVAEVRANESVQLAELEVRYRGTVAASNNVHLARIEAAYRVARAKCSGLSTTKRDTCLIEAHAQKANARMEAQSQFHGTPVIARNTATKQEG